MGLLPVVGLNAAVAKAGSGSNLFGSLAGLSNPLSAGLGILKGVSGLFGSTKSQTNQSAAYSGVGGFQSDNNYDFSVSKPIIDFDNPKHVAMAAAIVIIGVYVFKKVKK